MRKVGFHLLILFLFVPSLLSCVEGDESAYARYPAFFRFSPVTAAPNALLPSLNNPGEWCTISFAGTSYRFHSLTTGKDDSYPVTALDQYGTTVWIAGLIVGTPSLVDFSGNFYVVCYDQACPNCYEAGGIKRSITVTDVALAHAQCSRCHRTYDLQNGGIVIAGADSPNAPHLYRYRCSYGNNTFAVQN